ncbi:MAG TPA: ABC transporter permease [Candidatus Limnocylindria bacterium]|nr:ABC transporter permease [Candidatus Limnocylindria bacterium]
MNSTGALMRDDAALSGLGGGRPSERRKLLRRIWRTKGLVIGGSVVFVIVLIAVLGPFVAPHDPMRGRMLDRLAPPIWEGGTTEYILGTDALGRDELSRLILGARVSLEAGASGTLVAALFGVALGLLAGYFSGALDWVISSLVNIMLTFPFVLLALAIIAVLGTDFRNLIIVLALTSWPIYTRVIRAQVRGLRDREFMTAARVIGVGHLRAMVRHALPNTVNSIIVIASLQVAQLIILESFLSFLGLGVQPPTPSWGSMLGESRTYMFDRWWLAAMPGLAIFVTTLAINLLGDGLRDLLDPHGRNTI